MTLSIIIVSYNVKELLKNCLDSIIKFTKEVEFEIIVVDNASTDDSLSYLSSLSDIGNLKVIASQENVGYGNAINLGLRQAKGKYVLILNPDILFEEDCFSPVISWMETHGDVAVVSAQMLNSEHKISPTGGFLPTLPRVWLWAWGLDDIPGISQFLSQKIGLYQAKARDYTKEFQLGWVTGGYMMVRKTAIDNVGEFDKNIFLYGEEVEWCWRFNEAGWKIFFVPLCKFVHFERKSSGDQGSKNAIQGEFRGLRYLYGKHCPVWQQILLGTILDIGAFLRLIMWLLRRNLPMAKIYAEVMLN